MVHRQCAKLNNCELQYYGSLSSDWYCRECITSTFPFGGLNEEELDLFLNRDAPGKLQDIYIKCQDLNFEPFKFIDFNSNDPDADIDPDNNFYNHVTVDSLYYTEQQLEANNKEVGQGFSIIHFNARSMSANFEEIRSYLQEFSWKFDIIALSETWQKNDVNTDFKIIGYDDYGRARKERTGGGVLLYVHAEFNHRIVEELSYCKENVLECITVEVSITSKVKVFIMCVYRAPGTDIAQFNMEFEDILDKMKNRKIFICGDLNIDLLKCDSHNGTKHFVDLLYSNGYFPLISRPTRVTENSGTLIDNIFTSEISVGIKSGILINDITDHLPIFASIPYYSKKEEEVKEVFKRAVTSVGIENLKRDLSTVDWSFITGEQDPNRAYKKFMEIFNCFFNKHCPIKKVNSRVNEMSKPWLTTSLKNACKKKNSLYKEFLKYQTVSAEF